MTLNDTRQITGQLLAFDVHMNLVLSEAEDVRRPKRALHSKHPETVAEEKRTLGLVILRGEWIISISVEGPPPADPRDRLGKAAPGPGVGRAVGRGVGGQPLGSGVQVPGIGALGGLGGPVSRAAPPGNFAPPSGIGRGYAGR